MFGLFNNGTKETYTREARSTSTKIFLISATYFLFEIYNYNFTFNWRKCGGSFLKTQNSWINSMNTITICRKAARFYCSVDDFLYRLRIEVCSIYSNYRKGEFNGDMDVNMITHLRLVWIACDVFSSFRSNYQERLVEIHSQAIYSFPLPPPNVNKENLLYFRDIKPINRVYKQIENR